MENKWKKSCDQYDPEWETNKTNEKQMGDK